MFYQSIVDGKALPSYANTDAFQVSIKFFAPIKSVAFLKYITKLQPTLKNKKALSVQELITLQKICLGNNNGCANTVLDSLYKKGLLQKNGAVYSPNTDFIALQNATTDKTENKTTQKTTQKIISALSPKQQEILNYLSKNPSASRKELSENISGISEDGVKYNLKGLQQKGVIKRIGPDKGGHWEVISGNNK